MSKWLKYILGLIILAFLLWYLAVHWSELKVLLKFSPAQLSAMYILYFLINLIFARVVQRLISSLKTKTGFWDMVQLHNAALLLNYVPMKFGTLFRANYLKRHYDLSYAHFAVFFMYITLLMTATASVVGLLALACVYGLQGYENKILAGVLLLTIIASVLFLFIPLPIPKGRGRLVAILRNFLTGRKQISRERKAVFIAVFFLALTFLLTALRFGIIYHSMDRDIHPAGFFILGALGFVMLFIGFTPGSLGIRELVLGCGATVLGLPLGVGILAAMIDRAIIISYVFVVGGACALWLWHKQPADFKKQQNSLPQ